MFIAITGYTKNVYLVDLILVGFKDYVFKNNIYENLEKAIAAITTKKSFFPKGIKLKCDKTE